MHTAARCAASLVIGLLLLIPLGAVYGSAGLPVYHSWGLVHGSFTTAIPALATAAFVALGQIPWFGGSNDVLPRMISCACVLILVTALDWINLQSQFALSIWHLVLYFTLFAVFLLVCLRAARPLLIPPFLVVPLLVEPVFGLLLTARFDFQLSFWIFGHDLLRKVLPALVATGCAALLARLLRNREASNSRRNVAV